MSITPFFFDSSHLLGINSKLGDYFLVSGQISVAKGWHKLAEIIGKCPGVKFKFLFRNMVVALEALDKYNLSKFVESNQISIITNIENHSDLLNIMASARGVLIPSYYPTTGEFFLLESLGLGKVVLCFDSGVHKELIVQEQTGMIAPIEDVHKFADNITKINNDDVLCNKISLEANNLFADLMNDDNFESPLNSLWGN